MKVLSLTLGMISCLLANKEALKIFPKLTGQSCSTVIVSSKQECASIAPNYVIEYQYHVCQYSSA